MIPERRRTLDEPTVDCVAAGRAVLTPAARIAPDARVPIARMPVNATRREFLPYLSCSTAGKCPNPFMCKPRLHARVCTLAAQGQRMAQQGRHMPLSNVPDDLRIKREIMVRNQVAQPRRPQIARSCVRPSSGQSSLRWLSGRQVTTASYETRTRSRSTCCRALGFRPLLVTRSTGQRSRSSR